MITFFRFLIFVVPISLFSFLYFFMNDNDYYPGADLRVSDMPTFELTTLYDGSKINNLDLKGSFLINVWASWCITCRIEHGFLVNLSSKNIPIVGLNYKDERIDAVEWLNKYEDPYGLIIHDFSGSLALDMGVTGAPETFLNKEEQDPYYNSKIFYQKKDEIIQNLYMLLQHQTLLCFYL